MSMFAAFRDEIEKLATPVESNQQLISSLRSGREAGRNRPAFKTGRRAIEHDSKMRKTFKSHTVYVSNPQATMRVGMTAASPRVGRISSPEHASILKIKAPIPAPAVKAEASTGKKALSSIFRFMGEHKKLFGTVGGVAVATAAAAALAKSMRQKSNAPTAATPTNA